MRKKLLYVLALAAICAALWSCVKERLADPAAEIPEGILKSRNYFEREIGHVAIPDISRETSPVAPTKGLHRSAKFIGYDANARPDWERARSFLLDGADVVEVPLITRGRIFARTAMLHDGFMALQETAMYSVMLLKERPGGDYQLQIISVIPESGHTDIAVETAADRQNFSGVLLYSDSQGRILCGDVYRDHLLQYRLLGTRAHEAHPIHSGPCGNGCSSRNRPHGETSFTLKLTAERGIAPILTRSSEKIFDCFNCGGTGCYVCQWDPPVCYPDPDPPTPPPYIPPGPGNPGGGEGGSGSGGGGGGGGIGGGYLGMSHELKTLTNAVSLTESQIELLDRILEKLLEQCPYNALYNYLRDNGHKLTDIRIDPTMAHPGSYNYINDIMSFRDEASMGEAFEEEFIHFFQDYYYEGGLNRYIYSGRSNIEFEAKLLQDIACLLRGEGGSMSGSNSYIYTEWLYNITNFGEKFPTMDDLMNPHPEFDNYSYWRALEAFERYSEYKYPVDVYLDPEMISYVSSFGC